MPLLRAVVERLLLLIFGMARGLFLLQGLAAGSALAAVLAWTPPQTPVWFRSAMISILLLSGTYFIAGVLMIAARRWSVPPASGPLEPAWPWPVALGVSLLALPALAAIAASELPALWSQIAAKFAVIGFWDEWARGGSNSGLLLIRILLSLFVPAQVTAAALFSIALPPALLPLLAARSRLFPTLLAMGAVCQAALVLAGWLAAGAFARLAEESLSAMAASGDAEVLRLAEELRGATGVLVRTATALAAPLPGTLAWFAFLRPSGAAAAFFAERAYPAPVEAVAPVLVAEMPVAAASGPSSGTTTEALAPVLVAEMPVAPASGPSSGTTTKTPAPVPVAETPVGAYRAMARTPPAPGSRPRLAGLALAVPGALLLLFAAADGLRTRPSFASSQPAPGATLGQPPDSIRITLDAALDPASSLYLTLLGDPAGGVAREIAITRRLAPDDARLRTLEAIPAPLPAGLYRVAWQALPAGGGVGRHGSFSFGVGVPVPADTRGITHSLQDQDNGERGRRNTVAGGVLLLLLGALLRQKY